ncbi:MAG: hybrid sensor histidine kinase/response regulator [Nitratireductor sp.]|nr:hybrid sensor histidine kinase/response regulator [Nitratireductor sp.]
MHAEEVERLKKINQVLMDRVESAMDQQGNAFSLFQTAINLESQVRSRTDELSNALRRVERANNDLAAAKEAAEHANRAKTRFLAAASHDVLQPLNAAMLSLSVLADMQETGAGQLLATQIARSLETMNELLKTLLDISKLDAGVVEPKIEPIALHDLVDRLRSDFAPIAEEKGLELRIRCDHQTVLSDRTMLRRMLQNLLSNALRYTASGGVILAARPYREAIAVDVVDTGPGIPAAFREAVFEEFHRGALPTGHERDSASGLGLGLSIVRRVANTLGHGLQLDSVEGRGTRFRILLPRSKAPAPIGHEERRDLKAPASRLAGARILFIENDPAGITAGLTLFKSWGCDARVAGTSADVLGVLADTRWQPDIIVADQHLDHGDLGTLAVEAARQKLGSGVPALIVTADSSPELERAAHDNRMELMKKPLKPARLRALMNHLLDAR